MVGLYAVLMRHGVPANVAREIDQAYDNAGGPAAEPAGPFLKRLSLEIWDAYSELGGERDRAAAGGAS
jgi:hypothetical protein